VRLLTGAGEFEADFKIEDASDQGGNFSLVLESRGGNRNADYSKALEILLRAIGVGRMQITCIEVDSTLARKLPSSERRLPMSYPLEPDAREDLSDLRKKISRLQVPIAQQPGAKGGNPTKRIRIHVRSGDFAADDFADGVLPADGWLRRQAFLTTWNPDVVFTWDDREKEVRATERGDPVHGTWSTGNTKRGIRGGDLIFHLRQGSANRGIVGVGKAAGRGECVFEDEHFLPERAKRGDKANYVNVSWQLLLEDSDRIPIEKLKKSFGDYGFSWDNIPASGWRLPAELARDLLKKLDIQSERGTSPEIRDAEDDADARSGRRQGGQGPRINASQRLAIEKHSMAIARKHLRSLGCKGITDTSKGNPYDFYCRDWNGAELFVEVKGTTSGASNLLLTRREVELHRSEHPNNALLVVHGITLSGRVRVKADGGTVWFVHPWVIEDSALQVISYTYRTAKLPQSAEG
jgi:hypothetical protein